MWTEDVIYNTHTQSYNDGFPPPFPPPVPTLPQSLPCARSPSCCCWTGAGSNASSPAPARLRTVAWPPSPCILCRGHHKVTHMSPSGAWQQQQLQKNKNKNNTAELTLSCELHADTSHFTPPHTPPPPQSLCAAQELCAQAERAVIADCAPVHARR